MISLKITPCKAEQLGNLCTSFLIVCRPFFQAVCKLPITIALDHPALVASEQFACRSRSDRIFCASQLKLNKQCSAYDIGLCAVSSSHEIRGAWIISLVGIEFLLSRVDASDCNVFAVIKCGFWVAWLLCPILSARAREIIGTAAC